MSWRMAFVAVCAAALTAACTTTQEPEVVAEADDAVTCREVLNPGSNVLEEMCLTESDWERYRRQTRQQSQESLRRMQGFSAGF